MKLECRYCGAPLSCPEQGNRFYPSCRPMCAAEGRLTDRLARGEAVPGGPGACDQCGHLTLWHGEHGRYQRKPCTRCACKAFTEQDAARGYLSPAAIGDAA